MSVFEIDPETNDLVRDSSFRRVDGEQEIRQGVDTRLQTLAGERVWDLTGVGTRWLDLILKKGTPLGLIFGELTRRILSQPGMLTVDEIDATDLGDDTIRVDWSGTASLATQAELIRIQASTEISV